MFPQQPSQSSYPNMPFYPFPPAYPPVMYNNWAQQQQMMQMVHPNGPYMQNVASSSDVQASSPPEERQIRKKYEPIQKDKTDRKLKFDEVSGRLCLLNTCKKYVVTVGEICRRMSAPETLHTSLLNGILRNAKAKDNGVKLRTQLQNFNVQLAQGRRKTCKTTGFTALCEAETAELAQDLGRLLIFEGGPNEIAEYLLESESSGCDIIAELTVFNRWMTTIIGMHPENADPDDIDPKNAAEEAINHLSLLTHGFSHIAIPLVFRFALAIAEKMKNPEEKNTINVSSPSQSALPFAPNCQMPMFPMTPDTSTPSPQIQFTMSPFFPTPVFNPYLQPSMASSWPNQLPISSTMPFSGYNQTMSEPTQPLENRKEYTPLIQNKTERLEKFDEVSARLQLLSASRKYAVTAGEVCRRMGAPETLHSSLINGILRNAKGKDSGTQLRTKLKNFNVELPQGRRKTCQITKFTAFCEEEAASLAKDLQTLLMDDMHSGAWEIGRCLAGIMAGECFANEAETAKKWLLKMIAIHPVTSPEEFKATNKAEKAIHHLSLITHGFSNIIVPSVFDYAIKIIDVAVQTNLNHNQAAQQIPQPMMMPPMNPLFLQ